MGDAETAAALTLFRCHPRLSAADALLAAVTAAVDADAMVSTDRAFRGVPGVRLVDPAGPELERLLET